MTDPVSHPAHYTGGGIEPIDFMRSWSMPYCEAAAVKYLCRFRFKGTSILDLEKARQYVTFVLERPIPGPVPVAEFLDANQQLQAHERIILDALFHRRFVEARYLIYNLIDFMKKEITTKG